MPIKYNNFDIGNAYLGNDNLVAMYQGSNLVWTNGIKLKSLLGKVITNGGDSNWSLNINGTGELIANIDFPAPAFISTQKNLTVNENHYYYYFSGNTDENIQLSYYTNAGFYAKGYGAIVKGSNIQTLQPIWRFMTGLKKGNYHLTPFILDLTQAKLDTLTAQQVYDLITLNGTDFSDLELLASGRTINLATFKTQSTRTIDLGDLDWGNANQNRTNCLELYVKDAKLGVNTNVVSGGYYGYSMDAVGFVSPNVYIYDNGYIYISDDRFVGKSGNEIKQILKGTKLTYQLANTNNIANSKYGFIKLKDLATLYTLKNDGRFYSYDLANFIKRVNSSVIPNAYCGVNYTIKKADDIWDDDDKHDMSICIGGDGFFGIINNDFYGKGGNDLLSSFTDDDVFVYELANPLGDKLNDYTADQVYHMFFGTIGNTKMYVPKGKRFQCVDNVILGTKYGIRDLGDLDWYQSSDADTLYYSSAINEIKIVNDGTLPNVIYAKNFNVVSYASWESDMARNQPLESIAQWYTTRYIFIKTNISNNPTEVKNSLKGKYLIYELEQADGDNYNDLSAKQMFDLLNADGIDILTDGKSIGSRVEDGNNIRGIRSLCGKWDNPNATDVSNHPTFNGFYITKGGSGLEYNRMSYFLNLNIVKDHTYMLYVEFKDDLSESRKNENYNALFITNEKYEHICSEQWYMYQDKNFVVEIVNGLVDDVGVALSYYSNGAVVNKDEMIPTKAFVIDLTENNIPFVANHDKYEKTRCYNFIKEYNLNKLSKDNELNIGGLYEQKKLICK